MLVQIYKHYEVKVGFAVLIFNDLDEIFTVKSVNN